MNCDLEEWWHDFLPPERIFFLFQYWSMMQLLDVRDVVTEVMKRVITLWKRDHFQPEEGHRIYFQQTTSLTMMEALNQSIHQNHLDKLKSSKEILMKQDSFDEDYLEVLCIENRPNRVYGGTLRKGASVQLGKLKYPIKLPYYIHYQYMDIRDREGPRNLVSIQNIDEWYDYRLKQIRYQKIWRRVESICLKVKDYFTFDTSSCINDFLSR